MFSCLFLTTYYEKFLSDFYKEHPFLIKAPYNTQLKFFNEQKFGDCDFYSRGLKFAGWEAEDIILNCQPLLKSWADENNISGDNNTIVIERIRREKPDVIYIHDMNAFSKNIITAVRPYTKLIVGQAGTVIGRDMPYGDYDIIFSCLPYYVNYFRSQGITSYFQPLAFDDDIVNYLDQIDFDQRSIDCSFIGGISDLHKKSHQLLELLAKETPIEFWGYGIESLSQGSLIRDSHHGQAWGIEMFSLLAKSKITINRHHELAKEFAANMRLYEATGCGCMLITDYKDNLNELFEIGKELVAYRSPQECVALVKYFSAHPDEASKIAKAGQERTLRDHTYLQRMEDTSEILERHLRYRLEAKKYPIPDMSKISFGHKPIKPADVSQQMISAWQSDLIPDRQRAIVQISLGKMYKGEISNTDLALVDCLKPYLFPNTSLLEIGCASGYYFEILKYLLNQKIDYTGVDYSTPLISMAKDYYPNAKFYTGDGAKLPFRDGQFFAVISSCVLLHVLNYRDHIKEAARVAQQIIVAHRTPVCRNRPTQFLKKFAYGVETVELIFNEQEIIFEFLSHGLKLKKANQYFTCEDQDYYEVSYLFEKEDGSKAPTITEKCRSEFSVLPCKNQEPKMLNLGCGGRYHKDWVNIDFNASGPAVIKHNLCLGIPFPNEAFDVVYHSDLLEHFPRNYAPDFLKECWRVLKPDGIMRVVQPDLEQIVRLYLDALERSLQGDSEAQKRYEWLIIELLDQMVRNRSGGEMMEYWKQTPMPAKDFVIERCGSEVLGTLQFLRTQPQPANRNEDPYLNAIRNNDASQIKKMSLFRMSGEVHQWMYDRYSLKKILKETGFVDIKQCRADESEIPDFNLYLLDIEPNGKVRKPDSFFMEARKQP